MSSTKFVFFGPIGKTRWPPWLIRQKGGTLYSGARYVALWASCYFPNSLYVFSKYRRTHIFFWSDLRNSPLKQHTVFLVLTK